MSFPLSKKEFENLVFKKCLIGTSNFSDLDLKTTLFHECTIRDTYFTSANLMGANFRGSNLIGSTFYNTDLSKANFLGAINYAINPLTNKLIKTKFSIDLLRI